MTTLCPLRPNIHTNTFIDIYLGPQWLIFTTLFGVIMMVSMSVPPIFHTPQVASGVAIIIILKKINTKMCFSVFSGSHLLDSLMP